MRALELWTLGLGDSESNSESPFEDDWLLVWIKYNINSGSLFLSLYLYVDVEKLGDGGCIWIIMSALVLFLPRILNLTRTLDQDPSLTMFIIIHFPTYECGHATMWNCWCEQNFDIISLVIHCDLFFCNHI